MSRTFISVLIGVSVLVGIKSAAAGNYTTACSYGPDVSIGQLIAGDPTECRLVLLDPN